MKSLINKEDFSIADLQQIIDSETEESLYLEFKAAGALAKSDREKKEITKDVAAFANADGGVIIYGMSEIDHKAHSLSYVDGSKFTKEWLEQVITSGIGRPIKDLKIVPLRDTKLEQSIYIV